MSHKNEKKEKHAPGASSESSPKNKWQQFTEQEAAIDEESDMSESTGRNATAEQSGVAPEELNFASRQTLENQLTAVEQKWRAAEEQAMRVRAEMDNLRKRTEREVAQSIKFGTEKLIGDLLPIMDSLVRGLEAPASVDHPQVKTIHEGLSLTLDLLHKTLLKHGVQMIDPQPGDAFNPALHEAVSMQKDPQAKPNTILRTMQKGYLLNDRVLRAAMVVVAG